MWWIFLAAAILLVTLATFLLIVLGNRTIETLREQDPSTVEHWPSVSIVVAARNEETNIHAGITSLLELDYDACEIIVVNDRSEDRTGEILEQLATQSERLHILHIDQLPAGWLGKNHALWQGAQQAQGEYLLFTDADVLMAPRILRNSLAFVLRENADHLAIGPRPIMPSLLLQTFVVLFIDLFSLFTRPWKVADPKSSAFIGIGAFNLVRSEVYQAVGTHRVIAMRPDDDLKLGKVIKMAGYRQRVLFGGGMIRVPWYGSLGELILGLEKNAFSGVDYRVSVVVAATVLLVLVALWPYLAIWIVHGPAQYLYATAVLAQLSRSWMCAVELRQSPWCVLLLPVSVALLIYIQWRAMLLTFIRGGIRWRGTHYSLAELKANKI